ncbi:MAG: hypothetical protein RL266_386 [Bacteroidota bacterium]|jgi:uncharacterized protein (TIGR02145 family)
MRVYSNLFIVVIIASVFFGCNSDSGTTYDCGTGICVEGTGGDYSSAEECQLACNMGSGVTDIDGNSYGSIIIGTTEFTLSNLNVEHYRNGDPIPQVQDFEEWTDLSTGAWCYYENNSANGTTYGKLYNWYAVNDPRGLAPDGWHIPSDLELTTMIDFLGGKEVAGGKMKTTGTEHWLSPNEDATNASGFSGLPGGRLDDNIGFGRLKEEGHWWSSTAHSVPFAWSQAIAYSSDASSRLYGQKRNGNSVRCVKD